jgi:hypothetical protein
MMQIAFRHWPTLIAGGVIVLAGCGSKSGGGSSFDGENAPYGNRSPSTVSHSVIQKNGTSSNSVTQTVGEKTIGGTTYSRVTATDTADPSSGVEWWIKEKPGESVTIAGWDGHTQLANGIVPPGTVTLDQPLTVSLSPALNVPQTATSAATIQVPGDPTVHQGQATFNYTLVEDNAAIETSMGTIYGCKHFSGSASATSDLLPAALAGVSVQGDVWYHPSYGVVAFQAPLLGLGMEISDAGDCSDPDSSGHVIVRKTATLDSAHPFSVDTYGDCNRAFDADKDEHAQMLLELRWADDAKAKVGAPDTLGPMLHIEFGTVWGVYADTPVKTQVSAFHPEENGQGFNYLYAFVNQAAKNETSNGIAYHVSAKVDSGASAIRATGRIYYKKYGNSSRPDASTAVHDGAAAGLDAAAGDVRRDTLGTTWADVLVANPDGAAGLGGAPGFGGTSGLDSGRLGDTGGMGGTVDATRDSTDDGPPVACGGAIPCPTVIHSTTSGGIWSDTTTWVEKIVPTAATDVEINGPVVINAETPANNLTIKASGSLQNVGRGDPYAPTPTTVNGNLTIEAGGTLTNEPGWRSRIVVTGSCVNGGTLKNSNGGVLLEVKKSFTQNGTYEGPSIAFAGGADQTISCGPGKKIVGAVTVANASKSIKATSDLYLENVIVAMSDATASGMFDMNGFRLFVSGGASALTTDDISNHLPRVKYTNVAGINCAAGAMVYESAFANSTAPIAIDGVLTTVGRSAAGTQVTFEGDLTINAGAIMQNEEGWRSGVVVTGSLVNNGTVNARTGGYGFEIKKNFTQNGVYTATETTFSGTGVETISMGAGKKIAGTITLANAKSGGTLKALSDLTVENVVFTAGDPTTTTAIDMNQNKLILVGGANALVCDDSSNHPPRVTFANIGGITGASPDTTTDPMIWESAFQNATGAITLAGQFRTVGRSAGGVQVTFTGDVVLAAGALWRNEAGWHSGITISGTFTKTGTVVSDGGASLLVINSVAY